MFWNLILVSVFGTCAFAMYYPSEAEEAAYEMQKLLDISNFLTIQDEMEKITAALNENTGLEHQTDIAEQMLDMLSPSIDYLLQITKDLASPCREGIYRDGKCVNYIRKDKFSGISDDAENLCHAHFGTFIEENIIDYSDGPYGDHGSEGYYDHDFHGDGGGYYGDETNNGGQYGDAASEGGYYGDAANNGGYYGDAASEGGYYGDAASEGGNYGDATNNGGNYGDAPPNNGGTYGDSASPSLPAPDNDGDSASPSLPAPDALPPPVAYYVCYEPPAVNVPKNIYFPTEENEEEEEGEVPPGGDTPFPIPGSEIWFSGKFDPEHDEDECSLFAYYGKVIGKYCITVYAEPKDWQDAQDSCKARGGSLWEPSGTVAESTVAYSLLKEKFGAIVAEIETDADPSQSNILYAKIWTGWKQGTSSPYDFLSQIGSDTISTMALIFDPTIAPQSTGLAAAMVQSGTTWMGLDPETKLPWACQFNLVKK